MENMETGCISCDTLDLSYCLFERYQGTVLRHLREETDPGDDEEEDGYETVEETDVVEDEGNSETRKKCYRLFLLLWRGHLGKGIRMPLPSCVKDGVRKKFPSADGMYMGYKVK